MMEALIHHSVNEITQSKDSLRKTKKPLMEKRRRARINTCLNELKGLVLQAMNKNGSQFSKLEKADILEMTVQYLRGVQRTQMSSAMATDHTVVSKYRNGFVECAQEVVRYLNTVQGVNNTLRVRLIDHMSTCVQTVNAPSQVPTPQLAAVPQHPQTAVIHPQPQIVQTTLHTPVAIERTPLQPVFVHIPNATHDVPLNISSSLPTPPGSAEQPMSRLRVQCTQLSPCSGRYFTKSENIAILPETPVSMSKPNEITSSNHRTLSSSSPVNALVKNSLKRKLMSSESFCSHSKSNRMADSVSTQDPLWRPW